MAFFNSLETIRWKFSSAFAVGAVIGLLISSTSSQNNEVLYIGLILAFIVSVAGIVAQVRIFSLVVCIWEKILKLQKWENELAKEIFEFSELDYSMLRFPKVGIFKSKVLYVLSVGMISCFVFSSLAGLTIGYGVYKFGVRGYISFLIGIIIAFTLTLIANIGSKYYRKAIE